MDINNAGECAMRAELDRFDTSWMTPAQKKDFNTLLNAWDGYLATFDKRQKLRFKAWEHPQGLLAGFKEMQANNRDFIKKVQAFRNTIGEMNQKLYPLFYARAAEEAGLTPEQTTLLDAGITTVLKRADPLWRCGMYARGCFPEGNRQREDESYAKFTLELSTVQSLLQEARGL